MKKQLYSIKDDLSFDFEPPFSAITDVACLRMVSSQIQSEINSFNRGTVEYDPKPQHSTRSLYYVGTNQPCSTSKQVVLLKLWDDLVNFN